MVMGHAKAIESVKHKTECDCILDIIQYHVLGKIVSGCVGYSFLGLLSHFGVLCESDHHRRSMTRYFRKKCASMHSICT
jgi:hypothetical protein